MHMLLSIFAAVVSLTTATTSVTHSRESVNAIVRKFTDRLNWIDTIGDGVFPTSLPESYTATEKNILIELAQLPFSDFYDMVHEEARIHLDELAACPTCQPIIFDETSVAMEVGYIFGYLVRATRSDIVANTVFE